MNICHNRIEEIKLLTGVTIYICSCYIKLYKLCYINLHGIFYVLRIDHLLINPKCQIILYKVFLEVPVFLCGYYLNKYKQV